MRICSLLPSATEIVFALGLGEELVAVTHECDYPPEAREKPVIIRGRHDTGKLSSGEIDSLIGSSMERGEGIYQIDMELLMRLNPDIILTQELCKVCAVPYGEALSAVEALKGGAKVISLAPKDMNGIFENILAVGEATGRGEEARELVSSLREEVRKVSDLTASIKRPRVCCLEWLDPPWSAGHWVPEMVDVAGGKEGLGPKGLPSKKISWSQVVEYGPDILVLMPCGFDVDRTMKEAHLATRNELWAKVPAVKRDEAYAVDASSYFSRPGPRIVGGLKVLAEIIHPELFRGYAPEGSMRRLLQEELAFR